MSHPRWQVNRPSAHDGLSDSAVERSWAILTSTARLIRDDRRLALVALLAGLTQIAALLSLFGLSTLMPGTLGVRLGLAGLLMAWPLQVVSATAGVTLAAAGLAALEGRPVSVGAALTCAWRRRWAILGWATLATGVGVLLEQVAERLPFGGQVVVWLAGAAWSVATMFAIPVLVLEPSSPKQVVQRSARVFRARWGEGLVGTISIGVLVGVPLGISLSVLGAGVGSGSLLLIEVGAVASAVLVVVAFTVETLFALALFRFATGPEQAGAQGPYSADTLRGGLKLKEARRRG